ncbi:Fic family protein [Candidatus Dependentiae bacterium]|nr:Fic family protein [Candidatus Dependentiae bacterium]
MTKNARLGTYITQKLPQESFKAYVPPSLPPHPPIQLENLYRFLDKAMQSLAELDGVASAIPNISLFMYMYVRKEALLSSQIEGTQSSFADLMLFENQQEPQVSIDDVEEVSNYVAALQYGLQQLEKGFPLSLRLLKEIHAILLRGGRGNTKQPGEFRRSQNWIGGTRPGNALFVPPPPEKLMACLSDLEKFLHESSNKLPQLVCIGLIHVQFETIHPFLDGNGRLGRLLITLLLCEKRLLKKPILYLSLYLKQHRTLYYDLLQQVRTDGAWEAWLEFFLQGVSHTAEQALSTIKKMHALFSRHQASIDALSKAAPSCERVFNFLQKLPQVSVPLVAQQLQMSAPTARAALTKLVALGIVHEMSGKRRDRVYVYKEYLAILEEGTEPLSLIT